MNKSQQTKALAIVGGLLVLAYLIRKSAYATTPTEGDAPEAVEDLPEEDLSYDEPDPLYYEGDPGGLFDPPEHSYHNPHAQRWKGEQHMGRMPKHEGTPAERTFRFSIMSGRFDGSLLGLQSDLRQEQHKSSLAFLTEQGDNDRTKILRENPDWWVARPQDARAHRHAQENVTMGDGRIWEKLDSWDEELYGGNDQLAVRRMANPFYATVVVMRHRPTKYLLVTINTHLPAHLFKWNTLFHPENLPVWWKVFRALAKVKTKVRHKYPTARVMVVADWNVRQNSRMFQTAMAGRFPQFRNMGGGEFGNAWAVGVRPLHGRVLSSEGSDHEIQRITARLT